MKRLFLLITVLLFTASLVAQAPPQQPEGDRPRRGEDRGQWSGQGVAGTITAISADGFTLSTFGGKTATIKVGPATRFMRDRQPAKFSDFKTGEMVMVRGESAGTDTWNATMVVSRPADSARMREGLGKEFIAGEVKAIDGLKLTIARIDGQTQTIEVNGNTSFRKQRESITFPDIKVGDHVFGRGQLNQAGVFVPTVLNVGEPGMMMRGGGDRRPTQPPQ